MAEVFARPVAGFSRAPEVVAPGEAVMTASGAARGFEAFFETNFKVLLRAMYLVIGDRHEAEDVSQEAFVRLYERWEHVATLENPTGYLYRTAMNTYRNRLRRLAVRARRLFGGDEPDAISATDDRDMLRRALATLPERQREALVLIEWLDMTDQEAGKVLGIKPGTVRVSTSRARRSLRDRLGDRVDE